MHGARMKIIASRIL